MKNAVPPDIQNLAASIATSYMTKTCTMGMKTTHQD